MARQSTNDPDRDTATTGHEWDGIREYDKPTPRWWLWVLYASILWSVAYWIAMPSWPLIRDYTRGVLGYSQRLVLEQEINDARAAQEKFDIRLAMASLQQIRTDPELLEFAMAGGRSSYAVNCSQCHGLGAAGFPGYPNLNDDAWLWGGSLEAIQKTIRYGVRSDHPDTRDSVMPAFLKDELLTPAQINDVTEYVLALSGQKSDDGAARRGKIIYAEQCASCHRPTGKGNAEFGAPDLTDAIWLFGGDKKTISDIIAYSRRGVMPAWEARLDPVTIKQIAIYVHALGGGK